MRYRDAKIGTRIYFIDFPENPGTIEEIGNDYIHIKHDTCFECFGGIVTIHPSELRDYKLVI